MKIATTLIGLETILKRDVKGKVIYPGRVLFSKGSSRASLIVYDYLTSFKFNTEKEIYDKVKNIKFKIKKTFRVDCSRIGKHNFSSQDVRGNIGGLINKKVDLNNPEIIIYVDVVNDFCIIGLNPENVGKRNYKVRVNNDTLNACVAYSLLKLANFSKNKRLLDPFCSDGTILIEAGLLGGKKLYGFSQDIKNASINSKIAKVKLNLYKENLSWIGTLFKENSVDLIISKSVYQSKRRKLNEVDKVIKELFHQASFILKKNGLMLLISPKIDLLEKYSKIYKFKGKIELKVLSGDYEHKILSFKR